jgi:hypothetical protein
VASLREELGIPKPVSIRQYCEVEQQPLGFQAQVDMGVMKMTDMYGKRVKIYIFAMVMSASRMKFVYFQDCPFNAQTFIEAHDLAFRGNLYQPEIDSPDFEFLLMLTPLCPKDMLCVKSKSEMRCVAV